MLQDRSMSNLKDVVQVSRIAAGPRPSERHIANTPSYFRQMLACLFRVGLPADAMILQKAFQLGIVNGLAAQQVDSRLAEHANGLAGVERGGHGIHSSSRSSKGLSPFSDWPLTE